MKVQKFEFGEKPETAKFKRVETRKGVAEIHEPAEDADVNPFADTVQMNAIDRSAGPDQGARATISSED